MNSETRTEIGVVFVGIMFMFFGVIFVFQEITRTYNHPAFVILMPFWGAFLVWFVGWSRDNK